MMSRPEQSAFGNTNTILSGDQYDPRLLPEMAALSIPMKEVINSENVRELFQAVKKSLRRILKCDEVHFLLLDK